MLRARRRAWEMGASVDIDAEDAASTGGLSALRFCEGDSLECSSPGKTRAPDKPKRLLVGGFLPEFLETRAPFLVDFFPPLLDRSRVQSGAMPANFAAQH